MTKERKMPLMRAWGGGRERRGVDRRRVGGCRREGAQGGREEGVERNGRMDGRTTDRGTEGETEGGRGEGMKGRTDGRE